jgi:hypothetical protein
MHMTIIKRLCAVPLAAAALLLTACDHNPKEWKTPNMTALTPRLQSMFEKTKTVCFGRFMVDVPATATVAWGEADVPLAANIYPNGVNEVKALEQEFIDKLKSEKAINHNDVPLLLSVENVVQPEGEIVIGYEDFEAINGVKINGYFRLNNDGVVFNTHSFKDDKDGTIALIKSIARRLRHRTENEIPAEPGNCIEYAFLPDEPGTEKAPRAELVRIGFRLKEFPDAHLSVYVAPSNPHNPEGDSLEAKWKRIVGEATPEEEKALANSRFFRQSQRQIHDWQTGYEVLMRSPDEEGSRSHHDFQVKFTGVPHDPFKPYADIQFQTGVADNAAGATKASLTDEEAIAVWDKITSTIRVRPTGGAAVKSADLDPKPRLPFGELVVTGRVCPQTGWWESDESREVKDGRRQHIKAGDIMPPVISLGEPSLWQRLKGERPSYRAATVWKLVAYEDMPATIAQASPGNVANEGAGGMDEGSQNEETPPTEKG